MPLSRPVVQGGMQLLGEHFRRELSDGLSAIYLEALVPALEDDAFSTAVRVLIRERGPEFGYFPTVRDILTAAGGGADPAELARLKAADALTQAWENPSYSPHGYYHDEPQLGAVHGDTFLRALRAIGGGRRLLHTTPQWFPALRREFLDMFTCYQRAASQGETYTRALESGRASAARLRGQPVQIAGLAERNARALTSGAVPPPLSSEYPG